MSNGVYQRSIGMAAEILGGNDAVAKYLGVSTEDILSWIDGKTEPAMAFFQRIVDLIEESTVKAARTATVVRSRRDERR